MKLSETRSFIRLNSQAKTDFIVLYIMIIIFTKLLQSALASMSQKLGDAWETVLILNSLYVLSLMCGTLCEAKTISLASRCILHVAW